ncbi:MAG: ketoacyl-ACP synthase III [Bacteroidales bacterium]|jgi:3-oxoacyl-[acyl-carrier-protein] synthase-3|nr:ketoacyl-ACP synthase III [Bacteroidales bacterium]
MNPIRAAITGVGAYLPPDIITNEDLGRMVDTTDEWIMTRIGIKTRHVLKGEGKGASEMGVEAIKELFAKTGLKPEEVDLVICTTVTPDMLFPSTACIICDKLDIRNAIAFDMNAGCSGFVYGLSTIAKLVESGKYKKAILVATEKMTYITDYTDRATCPLFGDAAAAVLIEQTTENVGVLDEELYSDGVGRIHLHMKAGGSLRPSSYETIDAKEHFVYQEGQAVFKWAVSKMADTAVEVMERNSLDPNTTWLAPHQANLRIIDAVGQRMGIDPSRVMINIEKYGNTTSATIPLLLWEWEKKFKKGDDIILAAFGAGFTWGAIWLKWAY